MYVGIYICKKILFLLASVTLQFQKLILENTLNKKFDCVFCLVFLTETHLHITEYVSFDNTGTFYSKFHFFFFTRSILNYSNLMII